MLIYVNIVDQETFIHEFLCHETFENLYKIIGSKYPFKSDFYVYNLVDINGNEYFPENFLQESSLIDGDSLWYSRVQITGRYLENKGLKLKIEDKIVLFREKLDVSIESILYTVTLTRDCSPFPEEFLPGLRNKISLANYELVGKDESDTNYHIWVTTNSHIFKYLDNIIDKPSRFCFDERDRYTLHQTNFALDFIVPRLQQTKSVISGSWILNDFCNFEGSSPDDIDIFSESLDLLCLICKEFDVRARQKCLSYNSSFMSYDFTVYNPEDRWGFMNGVKINYIHVNADGFLTNNIENSSIERVLKFITNRFDLSCCIISFDGEYIHYNNSILNREMDICARITDIHVTKRICKYLNRGFKICNVKHTKTCQRLYRDRENNEREVVDNEITSLVYAAGHGYDQVTDILIDILRYSEIIQQKRDKIISSLLRYRVFKNHEQFLKVTDLFEFSQEEEFELIKSALCHARFKIFAGLLAEKRHLTQEQQRQLVQFAVENGKCLFLLHMNQCGFDTVDPYLYTENSLLVKYINDRVLCYSQGICTCEMIIRLLLGKSIPSYVEQYHTNYHGRCGYINTHK